jgi:hypothetical protein
VQVHFRDISKTLAEVVKTAQRVVGCMAWLSDPVVLSALATRDGVSLIVTNDSLLNNFTLRRAYDALQPHAGDHAILCVGRRTGKTRSLMHHKFLVGLTAHEEPLWVVAGSYNASKSAASNLESIFIFRCPRLARVYLEEYRAIRAIAKPMAAVRTPRTRAAR